MGFEYKSTEKPRERKSECKNGVSLASPSAFAFVLHSYCIAFLLDVREAMPVFRTEVR